MFKIDGKTISFSKTRELTEKQKTMLKGMHPNQANQYILSLLGIQKTRLYLNRMKSQKADMLAMKESGSILREFATLKNMDRNHSPMQSDFGHWIGVEIECFIPHDANPNGGGAESCDGDGCDDCPSDSRWSQRDAFAWLKRQLKESGCTRISVKDDGSLNSEDGHSVEVTMLFNGKHGFGPLEKLCKTLKDAGCYVNSSCGLHVHFDSRHLDPKAVKRMGAKIGYALPILRYMVPPSRQNNRYCQLGVSTLRGNRYFAVNLTAFSKFKTIEVRLHSGTISFSKIRNWIEILKAVAQSQVTAPMRFFQDLMDVGLSDSHIQYVENRINELNPRAWSIINPDNTSVSQFVTVEASIESLVEMGLVERSGSNYVLSELSHSRLSESDRESIRTRLQNQNVSTVLAGA